MHKCAVCPKKIADKQTTCSNKCRQKLHRQKAKVIAKKFVPEKMKCTECGKFYEAKELGWSPMLPDVNICNVCNTKLYKLAHKLAMGGSPPNAKGAYYKYQGVDFGFRNNRKVKLEDLPIEQQKAITFEKRTKSKNMGNAGVRPKAGRPTG